MGGTDGDLLTINYWRGGKDKKKGGKGDIATDFEKSTLGSGTLKKKIVGDLGCLGKGVQNIRGGNEGFWTNLATLRKRRCEEGRLGSIGEEGGQFEKKKIEEPIED